MNPIQTDIDLPDSANAGPLQPVDECGSSVAGRTVGSVREPNAPERVAAIGTPSNLPAYVMPVFQAQQDFEDTMRSLANSPTPCAVYVIDDGSQPRLETTDYGDRLVLKVIRLERNQGIVAALNIGLEAAMRAGHEYIARIDAGDYSSPERLAVQVAYFRSHPNCMLVGSDAEVWDENGSYCFTIQPPRDPRVLARALHERAWLLHPTVMYRAIVFREIGVYTDQYAAAEDYEMFLRIAGKYEIGVVPEPLLTYVLRKAGISRPESRIQAVSRLRIQIRYFQLTRWTSYYGVFRTVGTLVMPTWLKRALKMRFLYCRVPPPTTNENLKTPIGDRRVSPIFPASAHREHAPCEKAKTITFVCSKDATRDHPIQTEDA